MQLALMFGLGWFLGKVIYPAEGPFVDRVLEGLISGVIIIVLALLADWVVKKFKKQA